jgi:hypothetical protein
LYARYKRKSDYISQKFRNSAWKCEYFVTDIIFYVITRSKVKWIENILWRTGI